MTSARRGISEKLTLGEKWGGGGGVPYKVDINHDALKGWGKEKPKLRKKILLRSGLSFLGLNF